MSKRDDEGSALVEFVYLAIVLMVPLVYVLITVFLVQRAAFGTTEAARQGARAFARSETYDAGDLRARAGARLAMSDQGVHDGEDVAVDCLGTPCPDAGSRVRVSVVYQVRLPLLGALFGDSGRGSIRVQASHVEVVDRFKAP